MKALLFLAIALQLPAASTATGSWDPKAAATYLDERAAWWMDWKPAARDHETFCVSCHTALPYVMARPALRGAMSEQKPTAIEQRMLENVVKRVRLGAEAKPLYDKQHADESKGSEAVMNAFLLVSRDAAAGTFSADAKLAVDQMLELQDRTGENAGSIVWMDFHYQPWEASDARYWGATLAAATLGMAPAEYRSGARAGLLAGYLQREADGQPLFNQLGLLWASTKLPGLLKPAQREKIVREIASRQAEDGGWTAATLLRSDWKRRDASAAETKSDGYATALIAYTLRELEPVKESASLAKALGWLRTHQDAGSGSWPASSMNKQRDPASDAGKFMSDAATAYAVLALQAK
jgi:squalene-hopene/tetraprenyl-beta-curcumene cyclase